VVTPSPPPPGAEDKLRHIRSVTDAALSDLGADDLLTTLLNRVREILDADTAAVLLERRDEPVDIGITRLCQAVTPGPPEDVCVSMMHALIGSQYPGDDVALLVLRWLPGQAPASTAPAPGERRP
jgi:hypothetical protein